MFVAAFLRKTAHTFAHAALGFAAFFVASACASKAPSAPPKAYSVAEIAIEDAEGYKAYVAAAGPVVEKFGGVYLARGGETIGKEGEAPRGRIVIVEFPSLAAARAFYESAEYQAALPLRLKTATSRVYFVEGHAP